MMMMELLWPALANVHRHVLVTNAFTTQGAQFIRKGLLSVVGINVILQTNLQAKLFIT